MFLAINEIIKEKSRFVLITVVIILISYLAFFLTALAYGLASSYTTALDKWQASGVILNKNANDNIARSQLTKFDYQDLLSKSVAPLGSGQATIEADGSDDVSLFGIDTGSFLNPPLESGHSIESDHQVLISDKLKDIGIDIGQQIKFQGGDDEYSVVGIVKDTTFQTQPVVYMTLDDWRTAVSQTSGMTAMRDNTTISALVTRGDKKSSYDNDKHEWQSIKDFTFALPGYKPQVLTFSLMIGFLILIAAFVLAIFIYILTIQKKDIFGVLKAEGVPSGYIGRSVMVQVMLLSIAGLIIGMALAVGTGLALGAKVPFAINPLFFAGITVIFLICVALGAIASVRSVTKIDPVEAIG